MKMNTGHPSVRNSQKGMTLVIGMIMLIMISLAAVASYQMSRTSLELVGNMQYMNEALASTDSVIQEAISTARLHESPAAILTDTCGAANTKCFDFNGDGNNDVNVVLQTPTCIKLRIKPTTELDLNTIVGGLPRDAGCAVGGGLSGVEQANTGNSLCTDTIWELIAEATDTATNAKVTVTQGVSVTVKTTDAATFCP